MKKVFAKSQLRMLTVMFFLLGGLLLTAGRAEAQTYNWMDAPQALNELESEITELVAVLDVYFPGSPEYEDAQIHINYYKTIHSSVENGVQVGQAVNESLGMLSDTPDVESTLPPKDVLVQLFNDAVILLTN